MTKLLTVGYSNKLGGAGRALGRWEQLLSQSNELELISLHFDDYVSNTKGFTQKWDLVASKALSRVESSIGRKFSYSDNGILSLNSLPTFFGRELMSIKADFINLHWVNNEMISISQIKKIKEKIIWTLHDPWLINGLGNYPQRSVSYNPIEKIGNHVQFVRKEELLKQGAKFIAPSQWIANLFLANGVQEDHICVIPNPVPLDDFFPTNVDELRSRVGIRSGKLCVLLASDSLLSDSRKGMDVAMKILEKVARQVDINIITFGPFKNFDLGPNTTHFGYIKNNRFLNQIYNLADITFLPSRMDNLPQIMTESIASGTPVFALPHGDAMKLLVGEIGSCAASHDVDESVNSFLHYVSQTSNSRRLNIAKEARYLWNPSKILSSFHKFIEQ